MIIQAIQTSTETGVGRAIAQKTTDELNLEIDALDPDVRFLYELVTRVERQRSAEPGTPTEKSLSDAKELMSNTAKLQPGKFVEEITKHFSNTRSLARAFSQRIRTAVCWELGAWNSYQRACRATYSASTSPTSSSSRH